MHRMDRTGPNDLVSCGAYDLSPPMFNIAPESGWLEDYFPCGKVTFERSC